MSQSTYTAAVVGLSWISAQRLPPPAAFPMLQQMPRSHVSAYAAHPAVNLVGACDIMPAAIERFRADWANVLPNTRTYSDYREMIQAEKPDILSVVTPDDKHADIVVYAAEHGVRAIWCEKPIATTLADADRMIAATQKHGVIMSINHTRRWSPAFHKALEIVRDRRYGALKAINSVMHHTRAMLFRNGTHFVDVMNFLADAAPLWVSAELEDGFDHFDVYRGDGGREISSEPSVTAMIRYANGVRGLLSLVKSNNARYNFELVFDDAIVDVYNDRVRVSKAGAEETVAFDEWMQSWELAGLSELVALLNAGGGQSISPPNNARTALVVLLAMLQSHAQNGARVKINP